MISCPNCNHLNPNGATQCEACYTPLPSTKSCPNCGAEVQTDATFCGQCGFNLKPEATSSPDLSYGEESAEIPATVVNSPDWEEQTEPVSGFSVPDLPEETQETESFAPPDFLPPSQPNTAPSGGQMGSSTQLQIQNASLLHIQTNTSIELPQNLSVIHLGKPNEQIPPDIDVSGFPNSEIVSRIHADIRVEGDTYFIEDVGSSNGTYVNHNPLPAGNRHRLRTGDRIALGKGDKMTFIFQLT